MDEMRRPTNHDYRTVLDWLENAHLWWACERIFELVRHEPLRAWRMVQIMVAYAPSELVLGRVAAGLVEDLMGDPVKPLMLREAEVNPKFRICLGMAHGVPKDLQPFVDRQTKLADVQANAIEATAEEINLMVAWFAESATSWAPSLLDNLNRANPDEALFILRLLLASKESPHVRESVFVRAFHKFVRQNFPNYREDLVALAREHDDLRQWCVQRNNLLTEVVGGWAAFVEDLRSAD